ncbi:MAG: hypothetical protein DMF98_17665 [Acidobacteria bacterium]|nr:MAG: hypothetical protein DMF98_17665 [Acidobacteriota bacterium]
MIHWVRSLGVAWTKDGHGFFYGRHPELRPGKALEDTVRDKKIYYHVLGTPQSADLLIYERPEEPMLFIEVDIDETGRYVFFQTQRSISRNELIVKDLADPLVPSSMLPHERCISAFKFGATLPPRGAQEPRPEARVNDV